MPTPPTLVAFAENAAAVASGAAVTTASVTWQTGDVVIVVAGNEGAGTQTLNLPTTTGSGLTLTNQKLHQNSSDPGARCDAAVAASGSSGTFSVTDTHTGTLNVLIGVYIFRGSAGIGNSALGTGSGRTVALTATGADGSIVWIALDWAAAAVQAFTPATTSHGSGAPGPTASPVSVLVSTKYTYYIGELDDQTSAASVPYGVGGSGTGPFTIIACEAKAAAGGAAPIINLTMAPITGY